MGNAVGFGPFHLDLRTGELTGNGRRVFLQDKPFRILALLLRRPGQVVLRAELVQALWPDGTFVDFEHGLNTAMRRLRDALGDSAQTPRCIETIPRRGYRFITPLKPVDRSAALYFASADFKLRCLELVDRVRDFQTEVIVTRDGWPVARLVPFEEIGETSSIDTNGQSATAVQAAQLGLPAHVARASKSSRSRRGGLETMTRNTGDEP